MKFRVDVDGESLMLELRNEDGQTTYTLSGQMELSGRASVEEVMPGVFSVLVNDRSFQVHVASHGEAWEAWVGLERRLISLADPRDRASNSEKAGAKGPVELRAQMPGKIIKLLTAIGSAVTAGQGLMVVEAMKMQNEVKAPKDGTLTRFYVAEGETVGAGDPLLIVE